MKRFAALALVGSFQMVAVAGPPVSVHPASPTPPSSLNQPLSAAVQSAAATLPPPAPTMTGTPSWGTPAVYPGTLVNNCPPAPCADAPTSQPVRPYLNLLAPRGSGCDTARGTCLDKFKDWLCYRPTPGGFPCAPTPYRAPLRAYFRCTEPGCGTGACATGGCANGHAAPARGDWSNTMSVPVNRLSAGCETPTARPRVRYVPLTARAEVPAVGCDAHPCRPRLLERVMGFFTPKWGGMCGDATCTPASDTTPAPPGWSTSLPPAPAVAPAPASAPTLAPAPMPMPTGTPTFTPPLKSGGKVIQLSPQQPFTNP